jgi:hypothetical protein
MSLSESSAGDPHHTMPDPLLHPDVLPPRTRFVEDVCAVPPTEIPDQGGSSYLPAVRGYRIECELGRGGAGVVYRAYDPRLKRRVALKMLLDGIFAGPSQVRRFRAEAEAAARMRHPNFVQIFEVDEADGRPYFALELVEGGSLAKILEAGPLPVPDAVRLVNVLARAMEYAHRQDIVHRDLKPANVLLRKDDGGTTTTEPHAEGVGPVHSSSFGFHPMISDFGLAKDLARDGSGPTRSGAVLGTPTYMAPEQALGRTAEVGPASDVYALGVILYECLTGRPPFIGEVALDVMAAVVSDEPVPPSRLRPRLARDLDTICLKALAKEPGRRYPSALALAEDLDRFAAGEAVLARPESPFRKLARKARRHPVTMAALLLLVGGAAVGGYALWSQLQKVEGELAGARDLNRRHRHSAAVVRAERGMAMARGLPLAGDLGEQLDREANEARRGLVIDEFHATAERIRSEFDTDELPPDRDTVARLETQYRKLWDARDRLVTEAANGGPGAVLTNDLLDVALFWSGLRQRQGDAVGAARIVAEAEAICGPSRFLDHRRRVLEAGGASDPGPEPETVWEYSLRGRERLRAGDLAGAAADLQAAVDREPRDFWPNYYRGTCAFRAGQYARAIEAFGICVALYPRKVNCHYNHARACEAAGDTARALAGYARCLEWDPSFADARLARAAVFNRRGDDSAELAELTAALASGRDGATLRYKLALACLKSGDRTAARGHVDRLRELDPGHPHLTELAGLLRDSGENRPHSR